MAANFTEIPIKKYRAIVVFVAELSVIVHLTPALKGAATQAVMACVILDTMSGKGISIAKIARRLTLPRSNVTRSVAQLERAEWVRVVHSKRETLVWALPPDKNFIGRRDAAIRRLIAGLCD